MRLIFNDASEITIQQVSEIAGDLKIKMINQSRENILDMFLDQKRTRLMKVKENRETKVYERFTNYVSLTEFTGGIFEVRMSQEGQSLAEKLDSVINQMTDVQMALCEVYELMDQGASKDEDNSKQ